MNFSRFILYAPLFTVITVSSISMANAAKPPAAAAATGNFLWRGMYGLLDTVFVGAHESNKAKAAVEREKLDAWKAEPADRRHPMAPNDQMRHMVPMSEVLGLKIPGIYTTDVPPTIGDEETPRLFGLGCCPAVSTVAGKAVGYLLGCLPLNFCDRYCGPDLPEDQVMVGELSFTKKHKDALAVEPRYLFPASGEAVDVIGLSAMSGTFSRYLSAASLQEKSSILRGLPSSAFNPDIDVFKVGIPAYSQYPVKAGLRTLGGEAYLRTSHDGSLLTFAMHYQDQWYTPSHEKWNEVEKTIMATISTDLTVVHHLLNTHLIVAGTFAGVISQIPASHPMRQFLHPYTIDTNAINNNNSPILLYKGALFERLYSYERYTLLQIMSDRAGLFDFKTANPHESLDARGLAAFVQKDHSFETTQRAVWDVMRDHVQQYIEETYETEAALRSDPVMENFHKELKRVFVNSAQNIPDHFTRDALGDILCQFMYQASVEHDLVGVMNIHFLAWMNHIPPRVTLDGSPLPLGAAKLSANLLVATAPTRTISILSDDFDGLVPEGNKRGIVRSLRNALSDIHEENSKKNTALELYSITDPARIRHQVGS